MEPTSGGRPSPPSDAQNRDTPKAGEAASGGMPINEPDGVLVTSPAEVGGTDTSNNENSVDMPSPVGGGAAELPPSIGGGAVEMASPMAGSAEVPPMAGSAEVPPMAGSAEVPPMAGAIEMPPIGGGSAMPMMPGGQPAPLSDEPDPNLPLVACDGLNCQCIEQNSCNFGVCNAEQQGGNLPCNLTCNNSICAINCSASGCNAECTNRSICDIFEGQRTRTFNAMSGRTATFGVPPATARSSVPADPHACSSARVVAVIWSAETSLPCTLDCPTNDCELRCRDGASCQER